MTSTHSSPAARHDSVTVRLGSDQDGCPYTLTCGCGAVAPVLAVTDDVVPTWWAIHRAAHDAPPGRLVADLRTANEAEVVEARGGAWSSPEAENAHYEKDQAVSCGNVARQNGQE